jgi:tetratricopeptide (TPR) repeat protein
MAGTFVVIARIVMKKVTALMDVAQRDIQAARVEKSIKVLESGLKYAPWQIYVKGQILSQIGMIYFLKRDFAEAFPYLEKGFVKNWPAMGMLAVTYMKRNKTSKMIDTFENALAASKKEPLLWNLYGYCLDQVGERDKAIAAMEKGVKKVGGHELLESNLALYKEGKKMKMMDWGDLWYQFHLEKTGAIIKKQTKAIQGRRKMVMR